MKKRSLIHSTFHFQKQVPFGERLQPDIADCGAEVSSISRVVSSGIFFELMEQCPERCCERCIKNHKARFSNQKK